MFTLYVDAAACLVEARLSGFWDQCEVLRYQQEVISALGDIDGQSGVMRAFIDLRDFPVQTQMVTDSFLALFEQVPARRTARIAVLCRGQLAKLQLGRIAGSGQFTNVQYFTDMEGARGWLRGHG